MTMRQITVQPARCTLARWLHRLAYGLSSERTVIERVKPFVGR